MAVYASGNFAHVPVMVGATSDDAGGPDGVMIKGATQVASALSGQGVPVYHYRFSYVADSVRTPDTKGAAHATDIPFFFDTQAIKYGAATTAKDNAAGKLASSYLVNFVKTGDPNGPGLPRWAPFTDANPAMLDLAADGTAKPESVAVAR
jgi:para-nitrobenzyl esterase